MAGPSSSSVAARVALVTGGSRGIGAACVARLAADGYRVVFSGRDQPALARMQDQISTADTCLGVVADQRDPAAGQLLVDAAVERFGGLDVVVANAGSYSASPVATIDPRAWDDALLTNLTAVLWLIQAALPPLRRRGGHVLAIGSVSGTQGFAGEGAYGASKRALKILTDAVTREEAPFGVRATLVSPGVVRTDMAAKAFGGTRYGPNGDAPGLLEPADVAETVSYLLRLSPAARIDEIVVGDSRWAHA